MGYDNERNYQLFFGPFNELCNSIREYRSRTKHYLSLAKYIAEFRKDDEDHDDGHNDDNNARKNSNSSDENCNHKPLAMDIRCCACTSQVHRIAPILSSKRYVVD